MGRVSVSPSGGPEKVGKTSMSKETQEEYDKRQRKRKAKALQRATGMKYTEALRQVIADEERDIPDNIVLGEE